MDLTAVEPIPNRQSGAISKPSRILTLGPIHVFFPILTPPDISAQAIIRAYPVDAYTH